MMVCPFIETCMTKQVPQNKENTFCLIHEHCDRRKKLEAMNEEKRKEQQGI